MKKFISNGALVAMAAGAVLVSSCGDRDFYNPHYKVEEYAANWEAKFGQVDPNHDWSMATTVTTTVNVGKEGTYKVKIYSSDPADKTQQAYLLAKSVFNGGGNPVTLTFDAIKNMENVYVALVDEQNFGMVKAVALENGVAQADFFVSGSRKAKTRTADVGGFEVTDYVTFTRDEINEILENLPESVDAKDKFHNYEFVSNGEFLIYPVYGKTNSNDEIGYYYYDPRVSSVEARVEKTLISGLSNAKDEKNEDLTQYRFKYVSTCELYDYQFNDLKPISGFYYDGGGEKSIEKLQEILSSQFTKVEEGKYRWTGLEGKTIQSNGKNCLVTEGPCVEIQETLEWVNSDLQLSGLKVSDYWGPAKAEVEEGAWTSWSYSGTYGLIVEKDPVTGNDVVGQSKMNELRAKGFAINIPAGYRVGFWIRNGENKFYSNQSLNADGYYYSAVKTHSENGNMYFGLEDWLAESAYANGEGLDCNDIVFFVKNAGNNELPEPVEPTPTVPDDSEDVEMSWILACEDLGSLNDYDFNDIVLDVKRVNTYTNNVYEGSKLVVKCLAAGGTLPATIYYDGKEIGEAHKMLGSQSTSEMINTYSITNTSTEFIVDEGIGENWTLSENLDKFSIVVIQGNGSSASSAIITGATEGDVPQMIVVPGDWEWPTERTRIEDAYPEFKNWNSNALYTDWCSVKIADKVIGRK